MTGMIARGASKTDLISRERVLQKLRYDPDTGEFIWISGMSSPSKAQLQRRSFAAGSRSPEGYIHIKIDGITHKAHRLAWLIVHGDHADGIIDHINGIRHDNRISNLRLATKAQNKMNSGAQKNSRTGARGVRAKRSGGFEASIKISGSVHRLGHFQSLEDATRAYDSAAKAAFGDFYRSDIHANE